MPNVPAKNSSSKNGGHGIGGGGLAIPETVSVMEEAEPPLLQLLLLQLLLPKIEASATNIPNQF